MAIQVKKVTLLQHLLIWAFFTIFLVAALLDFQQNRRTKTTSQRFELNHIARNDEPIAPIPQTIILDEQKVQLGNRLYHDKRLSHDNTISCSSCHDLSKGGTDQVPFSTGLNNALGKLNSPTTFNSGYNFSQFWDGRAADLKEQASGPIHNPIEMASNWQEIVGKLSTDKTYTTAFAEIYFDEIKPEHIVDAIAVFEMSLITPNSRFDQYLRGDDNALTSKEKKGYALFKEFGCVSCHQGINMGGNLYQTLGVMEDYYSRRQPKEEDLGRYNVTKDDYNKYQFKVPTLRNIAVTFPYLHDGSAATLNEVMAVMWKSQLGRELNKEQSDLIVLFLHTLTGTYKGEPL